MTNHLGKEHSPYLLQHAENPVDWHPWNEEAFEKANEEFSAQVAACGLGAGNNTARAALKAAEDGLIEYGLSLVPVNVRGTLEQGMKERSAVRQQLIDLALRLDPSTVPSQKSK